MKPIKLHPCLVSIQSITLLLVITALSLSSYVARCTPYASGISNNAGTISFYLNEPGATVTVTFDDSSVDPTFNGVGTQSAGLKSFPLGVHTSYTISVTKTGSGSPNLIGQRTGLSNIRGVDANKRPNSPYFGQVYVSQGNVGFWAHNSDMSQINASGAAVGRTWTGNDSPYKLRILSDDSLAVSDYSATDSAIFLVDPALTTASVLLGPVGETAGQNAGVHGSEQSAPVITGSLGGGDMTLYVVDGDYPPGQLGSILTYHINSGPLPWQTGPDMVGANVDLNLSGIQFGLSSSLSRNPTTGYFYSSSGRANNSNPDASVIAPDTTTFLFDSRYNNNSADYFNTDVNGVNYSSSVTTNVVRDSCVSPDGKYLATIHSDNHITIALLTNGIPDVATLQRVVPTVFTTVGRGISWDAADNIYTTSSGEAAVQQWSLGLSTTAVTTGNASGGTGFTLNFAANAVSVAATANFASQGGANGVVGTPIPGVFTITRTNASSDYSAPMTVNFTLSGTATNGVYTTSPSAGITPGTGGSVVIAAGQSFTNISIIPATANVPRLQTTVVLKLAGGGAYSVTPPSSDTVYIQNTSGNQLVATAGAPTMYKAFSNDFASMTITRLGDTNVSVTTAPFTYSGTAVSGTDFTPLAPVTFNPGDIVKFATMSPLSSGVPPVDTVNPPYVGNKSVTVGLPAGTGYIISGANSTTLTLIDNANPSAPLLFSDPLTDANDAVNWAVTFGSGDETGHPADYTVDFGYDLTANNPNAVANGLIGLPPGGATNALRITCLKNISFSAAGGVNVYYTNQVFSNNFAVRFNMNVVESDNAFPVEGPLIGINHNGVETNWFLGNGSIISGGPWAADGVWYWVQTPPGGASGFGFAEFQEYTGTGGALPNTGSTQLATASASIFTNVFKSTVFTAPGGLPGGTPANNSPVSATPADNSWSDVELKQINNVVTLSIDKTRILTYTNTTHFTNGYLMLGYDCPIQGAFNQYIGTPDAAAYFANLRVVRLSGPSIISIVATNGGAGNVVLTFTSIDGDDTISSFAVQSASVVSGPYTDVSPAAAITQAGSGAFQAVTPINGAARYYRIRHL
jgi:hypothetical protein